MRNILSSLRRRQTLALGGLLVVLASGCGEDNLVGVPQLESPDGNGIDGAVLDGGADAEAGTDTTADTDTVAGSDGAVAPDEFAGSDESVGTDSSAGSDALEGTDGVAGTDVATGTDAEIGSDTVSGSDTGSGSGSDVDTGSDTGSGSGSDAATGSDTGSGSGSDVDSGSDTGSGSGSDVDTGSDSGSGSGSDAVSGTDSGSGSGSDTETGSDSVSGTDTVTGTDATAGSDTVVGPCGAGNCDDANPCTNDVCDPVSGCSWLPNSNGCDDGNACTTGDVCGVVPGKGPTCTAGTTPKNCDDGNVCTTDSCDPAGGCQTAPAAGACDDGSICTSGDTCSAGACVGTGSSACEDSNPCTTDKCDAATGACSYSASTAACDDGNPCTETDACSAGKCGGSAKVCDDANPCTTDSCDPVKGCIASAADGATCDDGAACTASSTCKGGQCVATAPCIVWSDAFACDQPTTWTIDKPAPDQGQQSRNVAWAVDQTPTVPEQAKYGCNLNFNDGTDHCDVVGFSTNSCQLPKGTATSPLLDFSQTGQLIPAVTFDILYDLDQIQLQYYTWDLPRIVVTDEAGAVLGEWLLPATAADMNIWKPAYTLEIPAAKGKKIKVAFSLSLPFNYSTDVGNKGKGIFVDNFAALALPPQESRCADSTDNDGDSLTDCADPDCATDVLCVADNAALFSGPACNNDGWQRDSTSQSVVWSNDATPAGVTPFSGACTLNFNDGTDYRPGGSTNPVSGTARWNTTINLAGKTKAYVQFMAYLDVEPNGDCNDGPGCSHADLLILEVSTDNFDGCACDPDESCDNFALCSDANTLSFVVPKDQLKAWKAYAFDISAFAGKSVRFRFRFDTLDGFYNEFPGAFVDDVRVVAQ